MIRTISVAASACSLFFFPYPFTLGISFLASLYYAPAALLIGVVAELLYFVPYEGAFPWALITGACLSPLAFFVRRFMKSYVIHA